MTDARRPNRTVIASAFGALAMGLIVSACDQNSPVDPLALSDVGLGAITKDTPFDLETIAVLYRDFLVEPESVVDESGAYPVIDVIEADQTLFTILPNFDEETIFRIEILHPFVTLDTGITIGDTFVTAMDPLPSEGPDPLAARCRWGTGPLAPYVICRPATHRHIYIVLSGNSLRDGDELPPITELESWSVLEMHWQP